MEQGEYITELSEWHTPLPKAQHSKYQIFRLSVRYFYAHVGENHYDEFKKWDADHRL